MKRIVVAAFAAFAMLAMSASAHVIYLSKGNVARTQAAKTMKDQCEGEMFTVKDFRTYGKAVYSRSVVSNKAKARIVRMHICQKSFEARVKVGLLHSKYVRNWKQFVLCSDYNPTACAIQAAAKFGISASWLINCAKSEGGLDPDGYHRMNSGGSGAGGNWQFMSGTFYAYAPRAGIRHPVWLNSHDQAYTAAYMFAHGQSGQWTGGGC